MSNPSSINDVGTLIKSTSRPLQNIFAKVKEIQLLNTHFSAYLEPHFEKYTFVVSRVSNRLVVMTANSAVATQLRFKAPDLITKFRDCPVLKDICHLHIKVLPYLAVPSTGRDKGLQKMGPLSMEVASIVMEAAKNLDDPKLSEIMARIASHCVEK